MRDRLMFLISVMTLVTAQPALSNSTTSPAILFDFGSGFDVGAVATTDAKAQVTPGGTLRIELGHQAPWPGVTLKAPKGKWDLSPYEHISLDVTNRSDRRLTVSCRVDNPGADGTNHCVTDQVSLDPETSQTLTVRIFPVPWKLDEPLELIGMRGNPVHAGKLDTANVTQLIVFTTRPAQNHVIEIGNVRAGGQVQILDASSFLPFIDEFGQYIHKEWPGKTHTVASMLLANQQEQEDLQVHARRRGWNKYGGWTDGPRLKATGYFRVQKHKGKWWLVDPIGRLFWSHGIDCVRSANPTPITDRERYFRNLPAQDSPLARFYGQASWAPHGYYSTHTPYRTYDFSLANLLRKHGEEFETAFADITHRRLESWGINTIANWSDERVYLLRLTPYVGTIHFEARKLEGSEGYWGKFYDVFDTSFQENLRTRLETERGKSAGDPWCLGYFVHNELSWGDDTSLAVAALVSPAEQPAKIVFVNDLEAKYETIENLNEAWGSTYASWDAMLSSRQTPDKTKAREDLQKFYTKTAETYFSTIRKELKRVAPDQLYLGCRFAWVNDLAAQAAAKFCDVVSYNRYEYGVENLRLPGGEDVPLIIGEFHFGALDRGMFHTGLRKADNQQDRADKYKRYVQSALRNPRIVGTHWFQYQDQPTTGRGDGENYQIGFVDICNTPHPEIVQAAREVALSMYQYRFDEVD
ncbi:MAG TPA: beta-galactosidase [Sedimentisphaerales bacterium]|nr:beta-galactosidase [Sedimentisphaerales bacterium]